MVSICVEWGFTSDLFPGTQTGLHELHRTTTAVKPGFRIFPDTQPGIHKLHRTSTMVKTDFWILLTLKQACTSFTGPPQWWKQTSKSFWHACLSVKNTCIQKAVFTMVEVLWSSCTPVWVSGKIQKPGFTTVEAHAHLFEGRDRPWKQFSPLWKSCEARTGQFEYQKWSL